MKIGTQQTTKTTRHGSSYSTRQMGVSNFHSGPGVTLDKTGASVIVDMAPSSLRGVLRYLLGGSSHES